MQATGAYEAVVSIELAYDALHRTQALLAYMKILDLRGPDAGRLLDESKRIYEQALSHFRLREFSIASEFASASAGLAYCVEILFMRSLRSDSNYPTLASLPPKHDPEIRETGKAEQDIEYIATLVAQLKLSLENASFLEEHRERVRRLVSWTEDLYEECKALYQRGASEDAMKVAEAAVWAGQSAEHLCKSTWVVQ